MSAATLTIVARNDFQIGRFLANRRKGTGRLVVTVPEPGRLVLSGPRIEEDERRGPARECEPEGGAEPRRSRKLAKSGRLRVRLEVAYSPTGGSTNVRQKIVKLVLKRAH